MTGWKIGGLTSQESSYRRQIKVEPHIFVDAAPKYEGVRYIARSASIPRASG